MQAENPNPLSPGALMTCQEDVLQCRPIMSRGCHKQPQAHCHPAEALALPHQCFPQERGTWGLKLPAPMLAPQSVQRAATHGDPQPPTKKRWPFGHVNAWLPSPVSRSALRTCDLSSGVAAQNAFATGMACAAVGDPCEAEAVMCRRAGSRACKGTSCRSRGSF